MAFEVSLWDIYSFQTYSCGYPLYKFIEFDLFVFHQSDPS